MANLLRWALKERQNIFFCTCSYLCLQLRLTRPPDRLYWNLERLLEFWSLWLAWYFLSLTQDLPATSKEHQSVITAVKKMTRLQITKAETKDHFQNRVSGLVSTWFRARVWGIKIELLICWFREMLRNTLFHSWANSKLQALVKPNVCVCIFS